MNNIQKQLFKMQDVEYKNFHSKLMPTVDDEKIIGIRIPVLRKFANEFAKSQEAETFVESLPHKYYEEDNLHAFVLEKIKDFDVAIKKTEAFLPYIDNWATCDMFMPKCFKSNSNYLLKEIKKWIKSKETYTTRYGILLLMKLFLDDNFKLEYAKLVAQIKSDEYYVNMMIAWFFATALSKHYDDILPFITENKLSVWVHNKTIQKAIESNRILNETKAFLKTLKR